MKFSKLFGLFCSGVIFLLMLNGCTVEVSDAEQDDPFSREEVYDYASSESFGKGSLDFDYVALDYIYNNDELIQKYGESFVVEDQGGNADNTRFIGLTKGTATYFVTIEGDRWVVLLSKEYLGRWEVTDCYQQDSVE